MIWASFCKKAASPIPPQKGRANQLAWVTCWKNTHEDVIKKTFKTPLSGWDIVSYVVQVYFSLYASIQIKASCHNISLTGNNLKNGKTKKTPLCALRANYFLHYYVYTSYADSKRSVSDRWLIKDRW